MTAAAYLSFASALTGYPKNNGLALPAYGDLEEVARWAVRHQMSLGHKDIKDYADAFDASARFVAEQYSAALPIMLSYARDEVFTLTLEELGLPKQLMH